MTQPNGREEKVPRLSDETSSNEVVPMEQSMTATNPPGVLFGSFNPLMVHNSPNTTMAGEIHYHITEHMVYKNIIENTAKSLQDLKNKNYPETRSVKTGCSMISERALVVIEGIQQSGKTTLAQQILAKAAKQHRLVPVILDRPEDYVHIPPSEKCAFLIDDIFGNAGISADSVLKWEKVLQNLLNSPRRDSSVLIISSESHVLLEAQNLNAPEALFHPKSRLDLSSKEHRLKSHEIYNIICRLVQAHRLDLSETDMFLLSQSIHHPWFYGCCQYLTKYRLSPKAFQDFLKYPVDFHVENLQLLARREPVKFSALVLMVKTLSVPRDFAEFQRVQNVHTSLQEIQRALNILQPIEIHQILSVLPSLIGFLKEDDGKYTIVHDSVKDAICLVLGGMSLEQVFLWCPQRFFLKNVVLESSSLQKQCLVISRDYFDIVKRRLLEKPSIELFAHQIFKVDQFVKDIYPELIQLLSPEDIYQILIISIAQKHTTLTKKLLPLVLEDKNSAQQRRMHEVLEVASGSGDIVSFKAMRKAGAEACGECFQKACQLQRNQFIVGSLLLDSSGIDLESLPSSCLLSAIEGLIRVKDKHNLDMVLEQLPSRDDHSTLMFKVLKGICSQGNQDVFEHVKEQGYVTDPASLMISAIEGGNKTLLNSLIVMCSQTQHSFGQYFLKACTLAEKEMAEIFADLNPALLQPSSEGQISPVLSSAALGPGYEPKVLKWLVEKGFSVRPSNSIGQTPLHLACESGNAKTVKFLLDSNADVTAIDKSGNTPLHANLLGDNPSPEILELLLKHGAGLMTKNLQQQTPLHVICGKNSPAVSVIVSWMLKKQKGSTDAVDAKGKTPLHILLETGGSVEALELLLDHRTDINTSTKEGQGPLHIAASSLNEAAIRLLLKKGCNPMQEDALRQTPLHITLSLQSERCSRIILGFLQKNKINIDSRNADGQTFLHLAAGNHTNVQLFASILSSGVQPSLPDKNGLTTMHIVCTNCNESDADKLQLLLQKGSHGNSQDSRGLTPLHLACLSTGSHRLTMVRQLIDHGADPTHQDQAGLTILHKLCSRSQELDLEVVKYLLTLIDPDCTDRKGETPLFKASRSDGDVARDIMKKLMDQGADCLKTAANGDVIDICVRHSRKRFQFLLEVVAQLACKVNSRYGIDTIRTLMQKGGLFIDTDEDGSTIVHKLCKIHQENSHKIINFFLSHGIDARAKTIEETTALHLACTNINQHSLPVVKALGERVNVRAKDLLRETALHKAARDSSEFSAEVILQLKSIGLDINAQNIDGDTALHLATRSNLLRNVQRLLTVGADISLTNHRDASAADLMMESSYHPSEILHLYCISACTLEMRQIRYLITKGADISCKDKGGDTVLHKICSRMDDNSYSNISVLLQAGADVNIPNSDNLTPFDIAAFKGLPEETVNMIRRWETADQETRVSMETEQTASTSSTALLPVGERKNSQHPLQEMHDQMDERKSRAQDSITASLAQGNFGNVGDDLVAIGIAELLRGGLKTLIKRDLKE